jgi:hypothetical protein
LGGGLLSTVVTVFQGSRLGLKDLMDLSSTTIEELSLMTIEEVEGPRTSDGAAGLLLLL